MFHRPDSHTPDIGSMSAEGVTQALAEASREYDRVSKTFAALCAGVTSECRDSRELNSRALHV